MSIEKISIVGLGPGSIDYMTNAAIAALADAAFLVGSGRVLDALPVDCRGERVELPKSGMSAAVIGALERCSARGKVALVVSGDPGFYSLSRKVTEHFGAGAVRAIPGVSSLQLIAARIGRSWVNVRSVTVHGRKLDGDPRELPLLLDDAPALVVMLGEGSRAKEQLAWLDELAGLGGAWAAIGWDLGLPREHVFIARTLTELRANPYTGRLAILWLEKDEGGR